jgi:outer membrane protein TolC
MRMGLPIKHARGGTRAAALAAACVLLAGCAAMPDLGARPTLRDPATLGALAADTPAGAWPGEGWWKDYGDPQLSALIEEALSGSPTLAVAEARARIDSSGRPIRLEIDGGVKVEKAAAIARAGADTFVAGSAIFGSGDYAATITAMREQIKLGQREPANKTG